MNADLTLDIEPDCEDYIADNDRSISPSLFGVDLTLDVEPEYDHDESVTPHRIHEHESFSPTRSISQATPKRICNLSLDIETFGSPIPFSMREIVTSTPAVNESDTSKQSSSPDLTLDIEPELDTSEDHGTPPQFVKNGVILTSTPSNKRKRSAYRSITTKSKIVTSLTEECFTNLVNGNPSSSSNLTLDIESELELSSESGTPRKFSRFTSNERRQMIRCSTLPIISPMLPSLVTCESPNPKLSDTIIEPDIDLGSSETLNQTVHVSSPTPSASKADDTSTPISKVSHIFGDEFNANCCAKQCLMKLCGEDVAECDITRKGNEIKQRQFILDSFKTFCDSDGNNEKFVIRSKELCREAWRRAHNISKYKMNSCWKLFKAKRSVVRHANRGKKRCSQKATMAEGWLAFLFDKIGDFMPHKDEIHLPPTYTKKGLYDRMVKEFSTQGVPPSEVVTYGHFTAMWKTKFSKYRIPKRSEFSQCSDCTRIKEGYMKCITEKDRQDVKQSERDHALTMENERKAYHFHRERARQEPDEITTIIIDGMDQSKTNLPHLVIRDKATTGLAKLRVHLTGILLHSGHVGGKETFI